jgi:hypothetical protein
VGAKRPALRNRPLTPVPAGLLVPVHQSPGRAPGWTFPDDLSGNDAVGDAVAPVTESGKATRQFWNRADIVQTIFGLPKGACQTYRFSAGTPWGGTLLLETNGLLRGLGETQRLPSGYTPWRWIVALHMLCSSKENQAPQPEFQQHQDRENTQPFRAPHESTARGFQGHCPTGGRCWYGISKKGHFRSRHGCRRSCDCRIFLVEMHFQVGSRFEQQPSFK